MERRLVEHASCPVGAADSREGRAADAGAERLPWPRTAERHARRRHPGACWTAHAAFLSDSEMECAGRARSRDFRRILQGMTKSAAVRRVLPTSPFKARIEAPRKHFAVGDRVTHDTYGLGRAIGVEGDSAIAVLVDFGSRQERITQPYAAMFKL